MYSNFVKRILDIFLSFLLLIILLPLFLMCIIFIKIDSKGPIFFMQNRIGKGGKIFRIYKLRTMTNKNRNFYISVLPSNSEITRVGRILRRLKIDELPQLLNILNGSMSFVGPRPLLPETYNKFKSEFTNRVLVSPGLTGLAQVNGNIYLSINEKIKFDNMYVENISFIFDIKILLKTFLIVIFGEDKFINSSDV